MPSFTSELRQRRVLPLLGAYLGGMWLLTELAGFAVERFGIPGRWADGLFLAIWLLLPSALLVIWRVGPPGDAEWQPRDRTVVGLNLVLAAAVLAFLPERAQAPDPATAELATAPAEDAPARERPARVAIFLRAEDAAGYQEAVGLLALTIADLDHDSRVQALTLITSPAIAARLRRNGRSDLLAAPLGDLRLAAQDARADAYVVARWVATDAGRQLVAEFHALSPDRGLPPMTAPAADAWAAADALAAEIRARFAPASLAADANDPDVRAVTTESPESLAAYAAGLEALTLANDPATAATQFQRAWAQDPDFTLAGYGHFLALGQLGRNEEAQANLRQLLPRMHRLPERQRFWLQVTATPDPQRKRVIYEAWRRKLPEDPEPKLALARFALAENPGDATALATMTELMLEDDRPVAHAQVADLHRRRGDVDTAESLLREGLARHPAEGLLTAPLAELLANTGRHDEARALLEEWAQLRPDLVSPWVQLSLLHVNQGRPAEALAAADQAEAQASNPGARRVALEHRAFLLFALGRTRQGLALLPGLLEMQQADAQATPLVYRHHLRYLAPHAQVHGREAALAWLRAATPAGLDPAIADYLRTAAETLVASTLADADGLATAIAARRAALASFDSNVSRQDRLLTDRYEAEGLHLSGQSADALARFRALEPAWRKAYAEGQASEPAGDNFYLPALDAATAAGDLAQARQWLALLEKSEPSDPNTLLARARLLAAEGDTAGARASLARALATWADADPDFRPAREARALAQRLAAGG